MAILVEYIRNIAVYVMFTALVGAFVPDGKLKGFTELFLNVILVIILITPITNLLGRDINSILLDFNFGMERQVMNENFNLLDNTQNELIINTFRDNLREQTRRLLTAFDEYDLVDAEFVVGVTEGDFGQIFEVYLTLQARQANIDTRQGIIRVEPVRVQAGSGRAVPPAQSDSDMYSETVLRIKNLLADFYNIPSSNIHVIHSTCRLTQ
ncbi:MAG: stage III sporulation protein AF [Defluviitaleaceae bacterium]|nr:stage III sporulation protein AF [Defluviitaleaceae bacterium]